MNIKGIDDVKGKKTDKKNEARETYIGGEKSGLMVEDDTNISSRIMKKAKQSQTPGQGQGQGEGQNTNTDRIIITMYANGFVVSDEGLFRDFSAPENKVFLQELENGVVPTELRKSYKKGLDVALEDRRGETYIPPKPKAEYFKGEGITMADTQPKKDIDADAVDPNDIKLIEGEDVYELHLKFPSGQRKTLKVNPSTLLAQVKAIVARAVKDEKFSLLYVFPPKEIIGDNMTLKELDLLDTNVNVKLM